MTALIDRLWAEVEPKLFITKDQFIQNLEGWEIAPVEIDGHLSFITLVKGPTFHFVSTGTGKKLTMAMIRNFLQGLIAKHGHATTKTPIEDSKQQRFNALIGFTETHRDNFDVHFRIERLRHV